RVRATQRVATPPAVASPPRLGERADGLHRETVRLPATRLPPRDRRRRPSERVAELRLGHAERLSDGADHLLRSVVHTRRRSNAYAENAYGAGSTSRRRTAGAVRNLSAGRSEMHAG